MIHLLIQLHLVLRLLHQLLYGLKHKSEAVIAVLVLQKHVELLFDRNIKTLQIDSGGEFRSFVFHLQSREIQHRVTCPHTSEQNGLIECRHRQIVELGLTLLAQASLPLTFYTVTDMSSSFFPTKIHAAMRCPKWQEAVHDGLTGLHNNHTWSLVPLPENQTPVECQ